MKRFFTLSLLWVACSSFACSQIDQQQVDLAGATAIHIYAAFSSVEVTIGEQGVVGIEHNQTTNEEDNMELRQLTFERVGDVLNIREVAPDGNRFGQGVVPKSVPALPQGAVPGSGSNSTRNLPVDDALRVVVPQGIPVSIVTDYGSIVVDNVEALLSAKAKYGSVNVIYRSGQVEPGLELYSRYGAVDITIPAGENLNLDLLTEYGSLLFDMELETDESASEEAEFYQRLVGKLGTGGRTLSCTAPYGNVYLRQG